MDYETIREHTGTDDYRTRLDILEDMRDAMADYTADELDADTIEDMARQVADNWPSISYRRRVVQWLQAGSPDFDQAPDVEYITDARQLINNDQAPSVNASINAILGVMLYGVARAVISDTLEDNTHADAVDAVNLAIGDHRTRLDVDRYAMTPPYEWTLWHSWDQTAIVTVEPRD
jgi:hypothetical protein